MRALVQRVKESSVAVQGSIVGEIGPGLTILLGVTHEDCEADSLFLAEKVVHLRLFADEQGKMNLSVLDVNGSILIVSQFTLYADCSKGRRPSFIDAAPAEKARLLYEHFCQAVRAFGVQVQTGVFQADMQVAIVNDGPVTVLIESR